MVVGSGCLYCFYGELALGGMANGQREWGKERHRHHSPFLLRHISPIKSPNCLHSTFIDSQFTPKLFLAKLFFGIFSELKMPADQTRLLFLQLVANEKDYLFGQNDKQINVDIGNGHHQIEKITAEGKRARWEKIGQQMVQSGGIHYLGKSYDELRMIYYDLRRRTTEKLKKLEEQHEGEEGNSRKTTVTLNERDFIILDIIGLNSLTPAIQENVNNFNERISTSQMANSPNSLTGEQSSSIMMKNEIIGIEEGDERQNEFERWITGGQIEDNGNGIEEEEDEQNGRRMGQIMMNGGRNNEKMDLGKGRKRKGRRMDENGGGEEEDGHGREQQKRMMIDSQFEMLVRQAKLNYFNSQINLAETKRKLIEEQRALAKAQKVESELRAELLRMEIQKAKEQQNQRKENK